MAEFIEKEAFIDRYRKLLCEDCDRRKGMKNGKMRFCYEIGEAPCRACSVDDMLSYVDDFPAADVRKVVRGNWIMTTERFAPERICSSCMCRFPVTAGESVKEILNFCPNCGAKMDKEENDDV